MGSCGCLVTTGASIHARTPFRVAAHRTRRADLPHLALGQDLTPSPTARRTQAGTSVRARSARKVREWIGPALASPDLVLEAQPPAQPTAV